MARKMMLDDAQVAGANRGESYGYNMFVIGASSSTPQMVLNFSARLPDMQSIIKGTCPLSPVGCLFISSQSDKNTLPKIFPAI
jgi:hypothetical protein